MTPAPLSTNCFNQIWRIIDHSADLVLAAAHAVRDHQFSLWDAQIWAAAKLHGISVVFSEDFNPGSRIGGVRFVNPFAGAFQLSDFL